MPTDEAKVVHHIEPRLEVPSTADWRRTVLSIQALETRAIEKGRKLALLELANRLANQVYETASTEQRFTQLDQAKDYTALVEAARDLGFRQGHNARTLAIVRELLTEAG